MAMRRFIMNVSTPEKWSQWENVPIDTVYSKQSEIHVQATKTAYFDGPEGYFLDTVTLQIMSVLHPVERKNRYRVLTRKWLT